MFSFRTLLASILLATVLVVVDAVPLPKRNQQLIKVPLQRLHNIRSDLPSHVQLQQHINRAHKRHARMTGREIPSDEVLAANLHRRLTEDSLSIDGKKRLYIPPVSVQQAKNVTVNEKRYSRTGTKGKIPVVVEDVNTLIGNGNGRGANRNGNNRGGKKAAAAAGAAVGAAAAAADAGAGAGAGASASNPNAQGFSKVALQALNKSGLTKANTPKGANSLGLDIEANDVGYIATFQIGTPPKDFKLLTDSGSADTWVGGETCVNVNVRGADCGKHNFLGKKSSSTFVDTGKPFQVTYGSGAVAGNIITDDLTVAGLKLAKHTFGVAAQETDDFANDATAFDGLMGLAQSKLSDQRVPTPPEALASAGLIKSAITSYKISRFQDQLNDGEITFGGIDESTIDPATLVTVDNVSKIGFWEAAMTLSVDGKDTGLKGRTAILDTGTTLIIAPPADAVALHKQIPGAQSDGQGGFLIPCTTSTQVALTFGKQTFPIDPRDLLFAPVNNNLAGMCQSSISSGQIGGATEWLVGDVFLKNAVFSHDVTNNKITLAIPKTAAKTSGGAAASNATDSAATASTAATAAGDATAAAATTSAPSGSTKASAAAKGAKGTAAAAATDAAAADSAAPAASDVVAPSGSTQAAAAAMAERASSNDS